VPANLQHSGLDAERCDSHPVAAVLRTTESETNFIDVRLLQCNECPLTSSLRGSTMTEELKNELQRVKGREMTPVEVEAQRVSFVYGNAPADDHGTKETVRRSLELA
jgi:hypothetical protein